MRLAPMNTMSAKIHLHHHDELRRTGVMHNVVIGRLHSAGPAQTIESPSREWRNESNIKRLQFEGETYRQELKFNEPALVLEF